ncbi:MAG: Sir2-family regulator protein [Pseudonocardiales bacterium]|nr:Sir2-family regulator protein [Pseudonocardiales bacterium]
MTDVLADPRLTDGVAALRTLLAGGDVLVLSGAGLSTESGIPDYRGPTGTLRRNAPMTYHSFVTDPAARQRYWARSYVGWRQIVDARPNAGHHAVAAFESADLLCGIVTQNVDGLHQAAGAREVVELHGGLDRTLCVECGHRAPRAALDQRLSALNPDFGAQVQGINPDGDVELPDAALDGFVTAGCTACGSDLLKPDVVFFGENVPPARVRRCFDLVDRARGILVLGSSLAVLSGFRFVRAAAGRGIPVAIVNQGPTRGDDLASVRVDAPLGEVLPSLAG